MVQAAWGPVLPWLLAGSQRPEYAAAQAALATNELGWQAGAVGRLLAGLIVARYAFNAALRGPTARLAARRGDSPGHRDGTRLLEEIWVTAGNLVILGAALFVMLRRNGGCWWLSTSTCLAGWPSLPTEAAVLRYYSLELAWYLHMLLKPVLRYGLPDGRDMLLHHCATLTLIVASYGTNLTRMGVLVLALFAVSNPLLHIAKICNQLSLGPMKIGGFVVFAAAFFVTRVLLAPWAVLKVAAVDTMRVMPYAREDFPTWWWGINVLLAVLYLMQLLWMKGIFRVLRSAAQHGSQAASAMSAKVDPAKRYADAHAEPAGPAGAAATAAPPAGSAPSLRQRLPRTPSPVEPPALSPSPAQ
ncbi:ceramide synthase 5 [Micractinium conductrix]|uniref:Ceramide synthase 5 n=1 Tax=Micractinium conductrix TaxID=554055 RepID=A0A2P6V5I9_9CHLO|nr:ceramide synthase 5 [Micractinium conductrix]|eukprot:PSC69361.1 ceramide synthase 5 [Micractinium conductrix]